MKTWLPVTGNTTSASLRERTRGNFSACESRSARFLAFEVSSFGQTATLWRVDCESEGVEAVDEDEDVDALLSTAEDSKLPAAELLLVDNHLWLRQSTGCEPTAADAKAPIKYSFANGRPDGKAKIDSRRMPVDARLLVQPSRWHARSVIITKENKPVHHRIAVLTLLKGTKLQQLRRTLLVNCEIGTTARNQFKFAAQRRLSGHSDCANLQ